MKKRRFLTCAMTLALVLSLAAPAVAAEGAYTVNGEEVPIISEGTDPADLLTLDWGDLIAPDWEPERSDATLVVNGVTAEEAVLTAENGVSYTDTATLNAILGTNLTGEKAAIRTAAVEAGWDVTWNSYTNQIVLLDREKLLTGVVIPERGWVEEDLSGLDKLAKRITAANTPAPGQSKMTIGTLELTYTALDSLDGDETCTARMRVETLSRDKVTEMHLSMDLGDLLRLLPAQAVERAKEELPQLGTKDLKTLLAGIKADMIYNGETGMLYVHAPILALLDESIDAQAWYALDASAALTAAGEEMTAAEVLYRSLLEESEENWAGADQAYSDWINKKAALCALFGPKAVTEQNRTLTWELDEKAVAAALQGAAAAVGVEGDWDEYSLFKECRLELTIDRDGRTSLDLALRPDTDGIAAALCEMEESYGLAELWASATAVDGVDFRLDAQSRTDGNGGSGEMELHVKNNFRLKVETKAVSGSSGKAPAGEPPERAVIIEM